MKPFILLIILFSVSLIATKLIKGRFEVMLPGTLAMSGMLIFTAIGHLLYTKGMEMMLPSFIPYKAQVVYLTGIIEVAAAVGLLIPSFRIVTAWLLITFFILILPANIHAAIKHIDYQRATSTGIGVNYLWFRVPLQTLFIVWTYFFAIRRFNSATESRFSYWSN